jgi:hypothetical protein
MSKEPCKATEQSAQEQRVAEIQPLDLRSVTLVPPAATQKHVAGN